MSRKRGFRKDERAVIHAALFPKQNGLCAYCQQPLEPDTCTIDHRVPVSRGGSTYASHNLVLACHECNADKANLTAKEFMRLRPHGKRPYYIFTKYLNFQTMMEAYSPDTAIHHVAQSKHIPEKHLYAVQVNMDYPTDKAGRSRVRRAYIRAAQIAREHGESLPRTQARTQETEKMEEVR